MSPGTARRTVVTVALLLAAVRGWQTFSGTAKTPFAEWAIGWGATFFFLALLSEPLPAAAGGLSLVIGVGDFLSNGAMLTSSLEGALASSAAPAAAPAAEASTSAAKHSKVAG